MAPDATHQAIETVFRIERARLIAGLVRIVRDVGRAEDLAQDALIAALADWPASGVPHNPGAWLMAAAKRRAIDGFRRDQMQARKHAEIALGQDEASEAELSALEAAMDDDIGDELLALIFTACHPVLPPPARAALTLRLIGGLTTEEIARAFLTSEPTIQQRIVRAKKTLRDSGLDYEVPIGPELRNRLSSVLEVIYLIFNEGYAATAGEDLIRPALCAEAQRLGRLLAARLADESEVFGLLALMEIQASRLNARTGPAGEAIPITAQNRGRWDQLLIRRGLAALGRARVLGGEHGPYALQAALAAEHAIARRPEETDWPRIATLYDVLREVTPSPVVDLNRAVAHAMAFGPEAGLLLLAPLQEVPTMRDHHLLHAARGDLLQRAGRAVEARAAFEKAAGLSLNARERDFLRQRAAACI